MPTVGSLFSGAGLLDAGLHLAGFEHAWFCESVPERRGLLRARFPGVPVFEDVRTVRGPFAAHAGGGGRPGEGRRGTVESDECPVGADDQGRDPIAPDAFGYALREQSEPVAGSGGTAVAGRAGEAAADSARDGEGGAGATAGADRERTGPCADDRACRVDVIAGGFPCRGVSTAGKREGLDNDETVGTFCPPPQSALPIFESVYSPSGFVVMVHEMVPSAPRSMVTGTTPLLPMPMARAQSGTAVSGESRTGGPMLEEAVRMLPTPASADGERQSATYGRGNPTLRGALLPTPTQQDGSNVAGASQDTTANRSPGGTDRHAGDTLIDLVHRWEAEASPSTGATTGPPSSDGKPSTGLRLNPSFVGWMMGEPLCNVCGLGWTDSACPHSATEFTSP